MTRDLVDAWFAAEPKHRVVCEPIEAVAALLPLLTDNGQPLDHERLAVIALNRKNRVIDSVVMTKGSNGYTVVDPKQIFRWALTRPGRQVVSSIILGHNHPSGDPVPSDQDLDVTRRMIQAGRVLGLTVVDHIVIGSTGTYCSMKERGEIE